MSLAHAGKLLLAAALWIVVGIGSSGTASAQGCQTGQGFRIAADPSGESRGCFAWKTPALNLHVITVRKMHPDVDVQILGYEKRRSGSSEWVAVHYDPPKRLRGTVSVIVSEPVPAFHNQSYKYYLTMRSRRSGDALIVMQHDTHVWSLALDAALPVAAQRLLLNMSALSIERLGILPRGTATGDFMAAGGWAGMLTMFGGSAAWSYFAGNSFSVATQDAFAQTLTDWAGEAAGYPIAGDAANALYGFLTSLHRSINYNVERIKQY